MITAPPVDQIGNNSSMMTSNPGEANCRIRSFSVSANLFATQLTKLDRARCDRTTPFGFPVVPDVNRTKAA